jgi:hypothetical protein
MEVIVVPTVAVPFWNTVELGRAFGSTMIDQAQLRKAAPPVRLSKIKYYLIDNIYGFILS